MKALNIVSLFEGFKQIQNKACLSKPQQTRQSCKAHHLKINQLPSKYLSISLIAASVFSLAACTNTSTNSAVNPIAGNQSEQVKGIQTELANNRTVEAAAKTQPNIVVILADDIGSGDISFYNKHFMQKAPIVETKAIDALAEQGVWFTNGHSATALCAPTRFAVLTGKNNYRSSAPWGVWNAFNKNAISSTDITLARVANQAGYSTAFVGKWHLGSDFAVKNSRKIYRGTDEGLNNKVDLSKIIGGGPTEMGFDYSFMLPTGIQGPLYLAYQNQDWYPLSQDSKIGLINQHTVNDPKTVSDKGPGMGDTAWQTQKIGDLISNKAAEFIQAQPDNEPFFLYYASPMAHLPHMPPTFFGDKKVAGTTPSAHLDMVYELDLQVERIVNALKQKGVFDNTLIIFTSDNGGLTYAVPGTLESGHQPSGIYRGSKNTPYEGGHRVPFIAVWPKQINAGQILDTPVVVQDILATMASATGVQLKPEQTPDSKSFLPLLIEPNNAQSREHMLLQGGTGTQLVYIKDDWKLIIKTNRKLTEFKPIALFNLKQNITEIENQNLVNKNTAKVQQMFSEYLAILKSGAASVTH